MGDHGRTVGGGGMRGGLVALLFLVGAVACNQPSTQPPPPPPPPGGAGGGVLGVNPDIPTTPGARTSVVTYGPWTVPASRGTEHGQEGMLRNRLAFNVPKPCTNCYITSVQPTLKWEDGRVANVDTGQWLHHMVLASSARSDPNCGLSILGLLGERIFASGNERTRVRAPVGYGYRIGALDSWNLIYDLMNSTMTPSRVKIEVTFGWVPDTTPGMKALRPVWLDVNQCGNSEVPARTGSYQYTYNWTVNVPGKLIGAGGHLHDGGTHITIRNESTGQLVCTSVAGYGGPGYEDPEGPGHEHDGDHGGTPPTTDGHGHTDADHARMHLSSMTQCVAPDGDRPVTTFTAGQRVSMTAYYDADKWSQHGGHPVMGIAVIYIAAS